MKRKQLVNYLCYGLIGLSACLQADAQSMESFSFNSTLTPSVESFAISKFGKLSPSLYTGVMSYSLPLYTYKDEDFAVPISLDYSFSGYKPSQHSGTVGYGWVLSCGGVITREVLGLPDDAIPAEQDGVGYAKALKSGTLHPDSTVESGKQFYLQHYVTDPSAVLNVNVFSDRPLYYGGVETTPDIFRFNFLGYSGEFMLTEDGTAKFFNTSSPSGELSMEYDFTDDYPNETSFSEIRIKTGNGYCYYFGGSHNNLEFSKSAGAGNSDFTITAWKLRKIVAPNGNELEFVYSDFQKDFSIFESYTPEMDANLVGTAIILGDYASSQTLEYTQATFYHLLTEIKVNGVSHVTFEYDTKNKDGVNYKENASYCFNRTLSPNGFQMYNYVVEEKRLSAVKIRNYSGHLVDEFTMTQTFTTGGSGASRMFLESVKGRKNGTHTFAYNITSNTVFPKNDTNGVDHWGYWNGQDTALSLKEYINNPVPSAPLTNLYQQLRSPSVKNSNSSFAKKGALTKIVYPTGGETRIEYEAHDVDDVVSGPNQYIPNTSSSVPGGVRVIPGGVRVSRLTNISDEISDATTYLYDGGVLMHMPRYAVRLGYKYEGIFSSPDGQGTFIKTVDVDAIGYTDDCSISALRDPHVTYSEVIAVNPDCSETVSTFFDVKDYVDVRMYNEEDSLHSGMEIISKENYFYPEDRVYYDGDISFLNQVRQTFLPNTHDYSRVRGKLKSVKEYDAEGVFQGGVDYHYGAALSPAHTQRMAYNALFNYVKIPIRIYAPLLQTERHYTVLDNGQVEERLDYAYNDAGQKTFIRRTSGDVSVVKRYRYYHELFPSQSGALYKTAIVNDVETTKGSDGLDYLRMYTHYHYDNIPNPRPSSIDVYTAETPRVVGNDVFAVPQDYQQRTVEYTYDENTQRLLREDYTGGQYYSYEWDPTGRFIVSTTQNEGSNTTSFIWKDMVGPILITYPTGQSKSYMYDGKNRLKNIFDTAGMLQVEYRYKYVNE